METGTGNKANINLILWLAISFVVYKFSDNIISLFKGGNSEAEDDLEELAKKYKNPLNPNYIPTKIPKETKEYKYSIFSMTTPKMVEIAKSIEKELNAPLISSHAKIVGDIKRARTKSDIAVISAIFKKISGKDLQSRIDEDFKTFYSKQRDVIFNYIVGLPQYIKIKK